MSAASHSCILIVCRIIYHCSSFRLPVKNQTSDNWWCGQISGIVVAVLAVGALVAAEGVAALVEVDSGDDCPHQACPAAHHSVNARFDVFITQSAAATNFEGTSNS